MPSGFLEILATTARQLHTKMGLHWDPEMDANAPYYFQQLITSLWSFLLWLLQGFWLDWTSLQVTKGIWKLNGLVTFPFCWWVSIQSRNNKYVQKCIGMCKTVSGKMLLLAHWLSLVNLYCRLTIWRKSLCCVVVARGCSYSRIVNTYCQRL